MIKGSFCIVSELPSPLSEWMQGIKVQCGNLTLNQHYERQSAVHAENVSAQDGHWLIFCF